MNIKKFLISIFIALGLSGCASVSSTWDWFFDDDDKETETEYQKEMAEEELIAEEALVEEELASEEFADEAMDEDEMMADEEAMADEEMMAEEEDDYGDSPNMPPANTIYFDYKSTEVSANALNILQMHAQYLRANPDVGATLVGNTDSVGGSSYNKGLGLERAKAVAEILVGMDVDPQQLRVVSKGQSDPADMGDSPQAAALNRRVDIVY